MIFLTNRAVASSLLSGFHQILMSDKDKEKTTFSAARRGLFQFKRMPFGLVNAPATFQRTMNIVLSGLYWKHVLVYIDDVICFNSCFSSHIVTIRQVLQRFSDFNLSVNLEKVLN